MRYFGSVLILVMACFAKKTACKEYTNAVRDRYIDFISHRVGLIEEGMHTFVYESKPKLTDLQLDVESVKAENKMLTEKVKEQETMIKTLQWATADMKKLELTREELDFITELKWTVFDLKFVNQELQEDACLRSTECFAWTGWSGCSVSCGTGIETRSRSCINSGRFSSMCKPIITEEQKCEGTKCKTTDDGAVSTKPAPTPAATPAPTPPTTATPSIATASPRTTKSPSPPPTTTTTVSYPAETTQVAENEPKPPGTKSVPVVWLKPLQLQTCPSGYTSYQGYCFRFSNRQDGRLVSTINCKDEGSHLVEIDSKEKQKVVFDYVSDVAPKYMVDMHEDFSKREYWDYKDIDRKTLIAIDGVRHHQETRFMNWKDEVMTYFHWRLGQPRNAKSDGSYCVTMNVLTGEWYMKCCSVTFFYICEANTTLTLN